MSAGAGNGRAGSRLGAWLALGAALVASGCGTYTLRGKVIEGDVSFIAIVDAADPRLAGPGLGGVALDLVSDPERLNRKKVGSELSGPNGEFAMRVDASGAGFLEYDTALTARREGYANAAQTFRLPPDSKRTLVILKRGRSTKANDDESLIDQANRYSK